MILRRRDKNSGARGKCSEVIFRLMHKVLNLRRESTDPAAVIFSSPAQKKFTNSSPMIGALSRFESTSRRFVDK
jgi:hypothetical protein